MLSILLTRQGGDKDKRHETVGHAPQPGDELGVWQLHTANNGDVPMNPSVVMGMSAPLP